jgi:hypothetical protein
MDPLAVAILIAIIACYFLPAFIAAQRGHPERPAITWLNILLGWTGAGWVAALLWSCSTPIRR